MSEERSEFGKFWDRITAGNIDDPQSEATARYREGGKSDGAILAERRTGAEVEASKQPTPKAAEPVKPIEVAVPVATETIKETVITPEMTKAAEDEGAKDVWKEQFADDKTPREKIAVPAVVKKTTVVAKPVAKAKAEPMPAKAPEDKPHPTPQQLEKGVQPNAFGSKYSMPEGAIEQAKYVVQGKDYVPPEEDVIDELDEPNAYGAKYSMPKSATEQFRMVFMGEDYTPSDSVRVRRKRNPAVDGIPK